MGQLTQDVELASEVLVDVAVLDAQVGRGREFRHRVRNYTSGFEFVQYFSRPGGSNTRTWTGLPFQKQRRGIGRRSEDSR
jgi:hypothetical protein